MNEPARLATGYGASTPAGDNLLNDFVRESAESYAAFGRARGDRVERIAGVATMVDAGSPLPFINRVVLEQPIDYPAPMLQPMTEVTIATPAALDAPGWHHFVGYLDGRPVASGAAYVGDRLVRVDNIATLEAARGRGYGRAMTAAAAGVDPAKPATLVASDLGRGVYERLGFVATLRVTYWLGSRPG